ncbi:vesicle-associated membrane protein-associated protein B/C-like isoform X2 [Orbicella faveolata]|uniref:vesicle-associated membrane protein-associated protein B/C-like isoform X2 n=1 Tax=Orbicella faveolata TaxID=48498 RepID=UPI0009E2E563|nr:vesicle-associated membrane protein-associated protein B/C-like isoform X2 [Orbicella faveolata]
MAKAEQVLKLEPATELRFRGSFTTVVTANLKLTNPTERKVCFKVKTTAPKRYCVRPNSGFVEPHGVVEVAVMLQPFEYDPKEKSKHKFMVQTMFAPEGEVDHETLWKEADQSAFMDSKLKCVFDYVEEGEAKHVENVGTNESENLSKEQPPVAKTSKTETLAVESTVIAPTQNSSYADPGVEVPTSTKSLLAETVRLRKNVDQLSSPATQASSSSVSVVPTENSSVNLPPMTIAYLILALIFGVVIGKFIV